MARKNPFKLPAKAKRLRSGNVFSRLSGRRAKELAEIESMGPEYDSFAPSTKARIRKLFRPKYTEQAHQAREATEYDRRYAAGDLPEWLIEGDPFRGTARLGKSKTVKSRPRRRKNMARRFNPYKGAFSGTGRAGESYSVGTLGAGTAHFIHGGKALCQQNKPKVQVHPSSATSICTRCVKIARINAGVTAVTPGGRETAQEKGLLAANSVAQTASSGKRFSAAKAAAAMKTRKKAAAKKRANSRLRRNRR